MALGDEAELLRNCYGSNDPAAVPSGATSGEKALFKILAALPEDDFVYYDVQIKHRYADFVVISPRLGVLMIEIKDWKPDTIVSADNNTIELRLRSHNKKVPHPLKQARQYALTLMDEIQTRLEGRVLLEQDGPHKGRIKFPISYLACLSRISDSDIQTLNLSSVFDVSRTLTKEWFTIAQDIPGDRLEGGFLLAISYQNFNLHRWTKHKSTTFVESYIPT